MDSSSANWTPAENKAFKEALADVGFNSSNWFQHLTSEFPNKTPTQLRDHVMEQDILNPQMKEGLRENSRCGSFAEEVMSLENTPMEKELEEAGSTAVGGEKGMAVMAGAAAGKRMHEEQEKPASRKRNLWTEQEHRLFLMGLNVHGKGNWKSIAKNFVHTRTPTQVASHAQKFFNHHLDQRQRRRHSILDITNPHPVAVRANKSVDSSILTNFNNLKQPSSPSKG